MLVPMEDNTRRPFGAAGLGAGPQRGRTGGLNPQWPMAPAGEAAGLARLVGGSAPITLTEQEASLVVDLLDQSAALAALTGRSGDPVAIRLAERLRSALSD